MNIFQVSWKNVWSKPWSSALSIVLIAFGVGLLSLLFLFKQQATEQFDKNQAGIDLVVGAKGSPLQLILNSMFHVDAPTGNIKIDDAKFLFNPKNPYIKDAVPLSVGDSYKTFRIVGTNNDIFKLYPATYQQGKIWSQAMEVTLGAQVATETQLKMGDRFYSSHGFNEGDLEHDDGEAYVVTGILAPHGSVVDKLILCDFSSVWAVHESHSHDEVHEIQQDSLASDNLSNAAELDDGHDHDHSHAKSMDILDYPDKEISSVLVRFDPDKRTAIPVINMPRNINENTPIMATSPTYELNKLLANVGSVLKALAYLAILIGLISGFSVFISLYNNLKDRKHELGMMRVAGAKPGQLFQLIIFEALIIGVIGALIGIVFAHLATWLLSAMLDQQFHYSLDSLRIYAEELWIIVATLLISVVAGLIPAFKAYRTDIIRSLGR